ncbi:MAG: dephospho-CoA kinase [Burkholderia sp.]|nr:dephospho-CoA kinase [Burkholderia sp.]
MFTIGLTGGIGSGKTTISRLFAARGASIIDADLIAHRLTASDGLAIPYIVSAFGIEYIAEDGSLNRSKMRSLIFSDDAAKKHLEAIIHPLIRKEMDRERFSIKGPYLLLVIPLLVESSMWKTHIARVLTIDCNIEMRIARIMRRNNNLMREQIEKMIACQASREAYIAIGDDLIANNSILNKLDTKVDELHKRYIALAYQSYKKDKYK